MRGCSLWPFFSALSTDRRSPASRDKGQSIDAPPPLQKALFEKLARSPKPGRLTKGSPDVLVGVIDNGFDFYHPLLKGSLLPVSMPPAAIIRSLRAISPTAP